MKIHVTPRRNALNRHTHEHLDLLVRVEADPADCAGRKPIALNLALVLDRSGSMSDGKLNEAKRCVARLIAGLSEQDSVALVDYDEQIETRFPLTPAKQAALLVESALAGISPRGSTALHRGWLSGAELLAAGVDKDCMTRVVLLSDGQANHGLSHIDDIVPQVKALASAGVTTTTVGLGRDFNEELMGAMATAGQGGSHYGERLEDMAEAFDAEIGLLKALAFRQVRLEIDPAVADAITVANGYALGDAGYQLPNIACESEAWALLRMPMHEAIRLSARFDSFRISISAVDAQGEPVRQDITVPFPQELSDDEYAAQPTDARAAKRSVELQAADIQLQARQAARDGDWYQVERLIAELKLLAADHEWIRASIPFLEELMQRRDEELFSKESYHKALYMRSRISSASESLGFNLNEELALPEFLRRKEAQGRRSKD